MSNAVTFLLGLALAASPLAAKGGTLVIAGGAISPDNAAIYRAFIEAAKGGDIAIIPSASGEPQASADSFAVNLVRHGMERGRITIVQVAMVDDPATVEVDEAGWASNASNVREIAKIEKASGIWFTGGDQARTMRLLMNEGKDSPMLDVMRKRLVSGAVIGGTSAGAAIMGSAMIICGDPRRANEKTSRDAGDCASQEGQAEPLVLGAGLGFLPGHVVDQHFSQRARLPRLLRATSCGSGKGIGVDENTALLVDLAARHARVVGEHGVTTVAAPHGKATCVSAAARNIRVDRYLAGQRFRLAK